jgi:hypothetical protein
VRAQELENRLYDRLGWDPALLVWTPEYIGFVDKIIAYEGDDSIIVWVREQDEKEIRIEVPAGTSYEDVINTVVMYITFG